MIRQKRDITLKIVELENGYIIEASLDYHDRISKYFKSISAKNLEEMYIQAIAALCKPRDEYISRCLDDFAKVKK